MYEDLLTQQKESIAPELEDLMEKFLNCRERLLQFSYYGTFVENVETVGQSMSLVEKIDTVNTGIQDLITSFGEITIDEETEEGESEDSQPDSLSPIDSYPASTGSNKDGNGTQGQREGSKREERFSRDEFTAAGNGFSTEVGYSVHFPESRQSSDGH